MKSLILGLEKLASERNIPNMSVDDITSAFNNLLDNGEFNFTQFCEKFNVLISTLKINIAEMSKSLNFDASYISRIRNNQRHPSDPMEFSNGVSNFIVRRYNKDNDKIAIANLINCATNDISTQQNYFCKLSTWLCCGSIKPNNQIDGFLKQLDEFNLNEYIRLIQFDKIKIPTMPFKLPTSKYYNGIKEMRNGELDFFKATVLSKNTEPVFMCSDMPMEDMAEDKDFAKKWMFAIAMTLKKGLHLNIIHNLDRPFNEMMLGLESWIPIYMTGQVSPYYLKGVPNLIYGHLTYVSGTIALSGECIQGVHSEGRYFLSNNKDEVSYCKKRAHYLLKNASPLIQIYREDSKNLYDSFLESDEKIIGNRHNILSSLPIYTLSNELLLKILSHNSIVPEAVEIINAFVDNQRESINKILSHSSVLDEFTKLSKDEFEKYPPSLPLSGIFFEKAIIYTYEEYLEHLKLTETLAKENRNYKIKYNEKNAFRNIQISIHTKRWITISKDTHPAIHFVIRHPKLCNAIENFVAPIIE